jgi:hypothetical protein
MAVYTRLRFVAKTLGEETVVQMKAAARADFNRWKAWYESEAWGHWRDELCENQKPNVELLKKAVAAGRPLPGFRHNQVWIELARLEGEPIEQWQPELWVNAKAVREVLETKWDASQNVVAELGYHVDDGYRPLHAPRELVLTFSAGGPFTKCDLSPGPGWLDRVNQLLRQLKVCGSLRKSALQRRRGHGMPEIIETLDVQIREDLTTLQQLPGHLGLICHIVSRSVRREGVQSPDAIAIGKDIWIVAALAKGPEGFLRHPEMEAIYRDPQKVGGIGDYSNAFPVRTNTLNKKLRPLRVKIIGERNEGWRLIDNPPPVAAK